MMHLHALLLAEFVHQLGQRCGRPAVEVDLVAVLRRNLQVDHLPAQGRGRPKDEGGRKMINLKGANCRVWGGPKVSAALSTEPSPKGKASGGHALVAGFLVRCAVRIVV